MASSAPYADHLVDMRVPARNICGNELPGYRMCMLDCQYLHCKTFLRANAGLALALIPFRPARYCQATSVDTLVTCRQRGTTTRRSPLASRPIYEQQQYQIFRMVERTQSTASSSAHDRGVSHQSAFLISSPTQTMV